MKRLLHWVPVILLAVAAKAWAGVVPVELQFDGSGKLNGAKNVLVRGALYDVAFRDGTCAEIFSGCNETTDIPLAPDGLDASQALLDQVLLGTFDSTPSLTSGCEFSILCIFATPTGLSLSSDAMGWALAWNGDDSRIFDKVEQGGNAARSALDFTNEIAYVWAVWSPSAPASVPEPASLGLVLLGLLALARCPSARR